MPSLAVLWAKVELTVANSTVHSSSPTKVQGNCLWTARTPNYYPWYGIATGGNGAHRTHQQALMGGDEPTCVGACNWHLFLHTVWSCGHPTHVQISNDQTDMSGRESYYRRGNINSNASKRLEVCSNCLEVSTHLISPEVKHERCVNQ